MIHILGQHDLWECARQVVLSALPDTPKNQAKIRDAIQAAKDTGMAPCLCALVLLQNIQVRTARSRTVHKLIEETKPKKGNSPKAEGG